LAFADPHTTAGARPHAAAHPHPLRLTHTIFKELLIKAAMDIAALDRQTSLPGIDECAPNGSARRDFNICIIEHQHRILSTEFQHDRKKARCRKLGDAFASGNTSGKY